jgi:uncharacterized membrane protein
VRVEASRSVNAPRDAVWQVVADPSRYLDFMADVTDWVPDRPDEPVSCGSRYTMHMLVRSAPVGGTIEIVEFEPPGDLAWTSITGVSQRGRWRLREREAGTTEVTLRLAYQAPGGVLGLVADRVAAPTVRGSLRRTLDNLARLVDGAHL